MHCWGCKKELDPLAEKGSTFAAFRCLECPMVLCHGCAEYHFGITDIEPRTGFKDQPKHTIIGIQAARISALEEEIKKLHSRRLS